MPLTAYSPLSLLRTQASTTCDLGFLDQNLHPEHDNTQASQAGRVLPTQGGFRARRDTTDTSFRCENKGNKRKNQDGGSLK